jgi:hypothetical protein
MPSIEDIKSDKYKCMFDQFISWTLLLYQLDGVSMVIPVPNADLMSFIQVFDNVIECQNRIRNSQKKVTLFGYYENMQRWLAHDINIPNNLECVKIFCGSDDCFFVNGWAGNHIKRHKNTAFHIITFEELNHQLLSFGYRYIQKLRKQFKNDFGVLNLLDQDYREICKTLGNCASYKANIEYQRIRESEEEQN